MMWLLYIIMNLALVFFTYMVGLRTIDYINRTLPSTAHYTLTPKLQINGILILIVLSCLNLIAIITLSTIMLLVVHVLNVLVVVVMIVGVLVSRLEEYLQ